MLKVRVGQDQDGLTLPSPSFLMSLLGFCLLGLCKVSHEVQALELPCRTTLDCAFSFSWNVAAMLAGTQSATQRARL